MAEQSPPKEKLVGDLETLVTLLEEGKDPTMDLFADHPLEVPDATTTPAANTNQSAAAAPEPVDTPTPEVPEQANLAPLAPVTATSPDMVQALMGSGWEAESQELVQAASASIQANQLDWNPDDTEALTQALQVRLQQSINGWLDTTLTEQIALLRQQLLSDLQQELTERVQSTLDKNRAQREQKEDGLNQLAQDPAATGNP